MAGVNDKMYDASAVNTNGQYFDNFGSNVLLYIRSTTSSIVGFWQRKR